MTVSIQRARVPTAIHELEGTASPSGVAYRSAASLISASNLIALGVTRYPALLLQSGARTFVAEPLGVLAAYAIAVVCIARTHGTYCDGILRTAIIFGLLGGALEIINIGIENSLPFAVRGPALQIVFMLSVFTSWGIAGFRTACSLGSIRAGLLAGVYSAAICMLIAVAAGFLIQFFLVPPRPDYVSTWSEFKRVD